jgi:hypothetical protein
MRLDIEIKGKPVLHKNGPSVSTFYVHRELPKRLKQNLKYLGMVYAQEETKTSGKKD